VGGSRRRYSAKKHLEHSTPSKSTSFTLPVGRDRPQQEAVHLNLQALRTLNLQLASLAHYIRGADLQACETGNIAAAMGLLGSCLSLVEPRGGLKIGLP
jgi:hypothetical protein